MATSPVDEVLSEDLASLQSLLHPIRSKYRAFGIQIGVSLDDIEAFKRKESDPSDILLDILSLRLKSLKPLMWSDIEEALRSPPINRHEIANEINKRKYIHCKSHDVSHEHGSENDESHIEKVDGRNQEEYWEKGRKQGSKCRESEKISSSSSSEDLSEDYAVSLTLSQRKDLKKLFKQYFGKLCVAIKDPAEIAAQLQSRGLISISEMKIIIASPHSNPERSIQLISYLQDKIKTSPVNIFTLIKELLLNTTLHNIGKEIMTKAGEVCPDDVADIFGSECEIQHPQLKTVIKSPSPTERRIKVKMEPASVKQDVPHHSQHTSSSVSTHTSGTVGESISQLCPAIKKYQNYLKTFYAAHSLAPADKYLPTLESPYVNLAMITRAKNSSHKKSINEFIQQGLHGVQDEIIIYKTSITMEQLLLDIKFSGNSGKQLSLVKQNVKRDCRGGFVLVHGPPGIGKSTFAWEYCKRWDEIEDLKKFLIVLLLKLREKWVLNATSLSDLFRYQYDPTLSKDIAAFFAESNGRHLLLILDGFDEVSHSFHEDSVIKSILCRELLPECTIILTTRPSAIASLRSFCQPCIDKHIEIIGFTEKEKIRYIIEIFSQEPELQVNFLKYMFYIPHVKSMMYIPLNCAIIATVYHESQCNRLLPFPRTKTQLYKALTNCILVRHMKSRKERYDPRGILPESLNEQDKQKFRELAKFAFDSYHKPGNAKKVTFFNEDITEGLVHFGFMNETTEMYLETGVQKILSFLHLSLQEYLAAWHMAHNYSTGFHIAYHRVVAEDMQNISCDSIPSSLLQFQLPPQERIKLLIIICHHMQKGHQSIGCPNESQAKQDRSSEPSTLFLNEILSSLTGDQLLKIFCANENLLHLSSGDAAIIESIANLKWLPVEPAVFLAGITGLKPQSGDENLWEEYFRYTTLSHRDVSLLCRSLYEAQNPSLLPYYCAVENRMNIYIGQNGTQSPYDSYALSYCVSKSFSKFNLSFSVKHDSDIACIEAFVKGLKDHYTNAATPTISSISIDIAAKSGELNKECMFWLTYAKLNVKFVDIICNAECLNFIEHFLVTQLNLKKLRLCARIPEGVFSLKWIPVLQYLTKLEDLIICLPFSNECDYPPTECFYSLQQEYKLRKVKLEFKLPPYNDAMSLFWNKMFRFSESDLFTYGLNLSSDSVNQIYESEKMESPLSADLLYSEAMIGSLLKLCAKSDMLLVLELPTKSICRANMVELSNVLLHCNNLKELSFRGTRLGYDGILYICNTLRHNKSLTKLSICDDGPLQPQHNIANSTNFLLELNHILKVNSTLQEIHIKCGVFSCFNNNSRYILWNGFGPLDEINTGSIVSGRSANLRRSYSTSHLTLPKSNAYHSLLYDYKWEHFKTKINTINFKERFSKRNINIKRRANSCQSFTAPIIQVLQAFSSLDSRLQRCLRIPDLL